MIDMNDFDYRKKRKTDCYYHIGDRIVTDKKDITITDVRFIADKRGYPKTKYKYRCNICGFDCNDFYYGGEHISEVFVTGSQIRNNKYCSCCSTKYVKANINSIAKTNPELIPYFSDEKDAERYNIYSNKKTNLNCPHCGDTKQSKISDLGLNKFSCPCCSDGLSMGERIVYMILKDNHIDFIKEFAFKNSRYQYDFYLSAFNMIIEVNGKQHYTETRIHRRDCFDEIVKNDINKREFALSNGIKEYIYIDCQKSNVDYIINSIYESGILSLLNIEDIDVDLIKRNIHIHTITKEICDLYNSNEKISIKDICEQLHFDKNTVRNHLKQGSELGWCDYNVETYRFSNRAKKVDYSMDAPDTTKPIKCNNIYFKGTRLCSELSRRIFGKYISDSGVRYKLKENLSWDKIYTFEYITKEEFNEAYNNGMECYGKPYII